VDVRQLEMLSAVIHSGGYTQAGKALYLSHSAIHRQIRLLEEELKCRLVNRVGRRVEPTEAGQVLAQLTQHIRQDISDACRQINDMNQLRRGRLRIGTGSSILASFLPAVLRCYRKEFPGVHIHLTTGIADDILEDVQSGKLDVGVLFNPTDFPRRMPEIEHENLYKEEFDWAFGVGHALANQSRVTLADLAEHSLITLPPRSHLRRECDRLFAGRDRVPVVVTELESEEAIDKLVELNLGFALRSRHRPPNPKIRCLRIPDRSIQCEVGMVWRKRSYIPRAILEFLRICRKVRKPDPR
jgi:DNA-binding transcriptional LysR family regulator